MKRNSVRFDAEHFVRAVETVRDAMTGKRKLALRTTLVVVGNRREIFFARKPAVREPALAARVYTDARLPGDGNAGLRFARRHRSARHRQRS